VIYQRPTLTEYVIARLISMIILISIFYTLALIFTPLVYQNLFFHIVLFILSQILLLFAVYIGAKRVRNELKTVEKYLSGIDDFDKATPLVHFFTREFEGINMKLVQILRRMKKREKEKRKYTAKIKLKNRQRSDMLSAIAHEFRNPIASIMGYAQTLNEDEDIPLELRKKFLEKIYNNGDKIEGLLSRLLLWNRFESGEQKIQISHFNLRPLIREIAINLEDKYKGREIHVDDAELFIDVDKALIEIVIKNLLENALKYSTEPIHVKINGRRISVEDKGVGISEENLEKVTKKFYRTDEHSWDNSMGLGLAIVKQILKLHAVVLKIESEENVGSSFSFTLS